MACDAKEVIEILIKESDRYKSRKHSDAIEKYKQVLSGLLADTTVGGNTPTQEVEDSVEYQKISSLPSKRSDEVLFNAIKEKLQATFPEITASRVDTIIAKNGSKAIGSAIRDMVSYTNDASVDTLPHEYAHIYLNILEDTLFIANAIGKVKKDKGVSTKEAKEILADAMGKEYVNVFAGEKAALGRRLWKGIVSIFKRLFSKEARKQLAFDRDVREATARLYNGTNAKAIRFTPKEGTAKVDPTYDFNNQPFPAGILKSVMKGVNPGDAVFTGSEALAMQGDVYRKHGKNGTDLHDIDIVVTADSINKVEGILSSKYNTNKIYDFTIPSGKFTDNVEELVRMVPALMVLEPVIRPIGKLISDHNIRTYIITPKGTTATDIIRFKKNGRVIAYKLVNSKGKVVGTYNAEVEQQGARSIILEESTTGEKATIVDLMVNKQLKDIFTWNHGGVDITVAGAEYIFKAKWDIGRKAARDKDIMDNTSFYNRDFTAIDYQLKDGSLTLDTNSKSLLAPAVESSYKVTEKGFTPKDEVHLTVLGFPQGKELKDIFAEDPSKEAKVQKLIDEADFTYTETDELYKISRDREAFIDWNNKDKGKETLHEEAIIQLVKAPGVKVFIDKINKELGTSFPVPFPHISLAVKGTKFGIGIPNEEAFEGLSPVRVYKGIEHTTTTKKNQYEKAGIRDKFDIKLHKKIEAILKKLYPNIKLNYTTESIKYTDANGNIMNQEEVDNKIKVGLKVVEALNDLGSTKPAKHGGTSQPVLSTIRLKNKEGIAKKLAAKDVSKEQIEFMFEFMKQNNIDEINIKELAERVMFGLVQNVEINTTAFAAEIDERFETYKTIPYGSLRTFEADGVTYVREVDNQYGSSYYTDKRWGPKITEATYKEAYATLFSVQNTAYYKNLSVGDHESNPDWEYAEVEISTPDVIVARKGHAEFATDKGIGWYRIWKNKKTSVLELQEMQSDMFQKMKGNSLEYSKEIHYIQDTIATIKEDIKEVKNSLKGTKNTERLKLLDEKLKSFSEALHINEKELESLMQKEAPDTVKAMHQMLNTDNKWVKFFIQSIVQDAQKKGYKNIRFPSGETAAKVEGHDSIAEQINQLEDGINNPSKYYNYNGVHSLKYGTTELTTEDLTNKEFSDALKIERDELKTQGIEKLAPIEGFYQVRVRNTLMKTYGRENVKTVTDEHGNTWFEVTLDANRDSNTIMLQQGNGEILGQANMEAETVLINSLLQRQDTLPHEYAHHYINMFRDAPIVKEAIKKWGNLDKPITLDTTPVIKNGHIENTLGEIYDITSVFETLGVHVRNTVQVEVTLEDVLNFQTEVLELINHGNLTKTSLQKLADTTPWLLNSNSLAVLKHKRDRSKRANSKNGKRYGKENTYTEKEEITYLTYQLVEEANEVMNASNIGSKRLEDLLNKQKALLKITRFGANTKIKAVNSTSENEVYELDTKGNPLTNLTKAQQLFTDNININNISQYLKSINEEIKSVGEEALVQAIGEQVVKQKGEAWNWWKKFSKWVKGFISNLDAQTKEDLKNLLTDSFLMNLDLNKDIEMFKEWKASTQTSISDKDVKMAINNVIINNKEC